MYQEEVNKLRTELKSAQSEMSTLKEHSVNAPEPSHLDEVLNFILMNYQSLLAFILIFYLATVSHFPTARVTHSISMCS
jgi:hypothetical protein